ncbi:MAG: hypothetical protein PF450_12005 [Bacteroidales bacterium]|jgi:ribosome maturation factor RimP|nr:hypothetical protein [Bacteroidales bacterium]
MIEEIEHLVNEAALESGYMVYSSSVVLRGDSTRVIVKIDSHEGISHSDCEIYSRALDEKFMVASLLPNFILEISSPGLDRELRSVDDYIRFLQSPVKVKHSSDKGIIVTIGKLEKVNEDSLMLKLEKKEVSIAFNSIEMVSLDY